LLLISVIVKARQRADETGKKVTLRIVELPMGQCIYCGLSAGMLRQEHAACASQHTIALKKIPHFFVEYLKSSMSAQRFHEMVADIAATHFVREDELRGLARLGIHGMSATACIDGVLTEADEVRITELCNMFGITMKDLSGSGLAYMLAKLKIVRELEVGKLPTGGRIEGPMPINLQHGDNLIWVFNDVTYLTLKKKIEFMGGSSGVSLRVVNGVYVRTGGYKGRGVQTEQVTSDGVGDLVLTNRNIYFKSTTLAFRIPIAKILSVDPFEDGIQIIRDRANARPEVFMLDDPQFAANVLSSLNRLDRGE
jgi:hypothetical protein